MARAIASAVSLALVLRAAVGINVVVIRHGERPANGADDHGHLTTDGQHRAAFLASKWGGGAGPLRNIGQTALIYCYGPNAYREKELLAPLSGNAASFEECDLINSKFGCGDKWPVSGSTKMNSCAKKLVCARVTNML